MRRYLVLYHSQFYEICETTIRTLRETDPKIIYTDKSKLFDYAMKNNVPSSQWKELVYKLMVDKDNDWIFVEEQAQSQNNSVSIKHEDGNDFGNKDENIESDKQSINDDPENKSIPSIHEIKVNDENNNEDNEIGDEDINAEDNPYEIK